MRTRGWWVGLVLLAAAACRRPTDEDGRRLVTAYLKSVVDAYRSSDEQIVDPLVSERQGLKLLGLIGVKRDADVYLDAQLLEIRFDQVVPARDRIEVLTHERWHYADRKIGSGAQVGEDSTDAYALRYVFVRQGGKWLLDELSFGAPPQVGRKLAPTPIDRRAAHGLPPPEDATGPGAPAPSAPAGQGGQEKAR